MRDAHYGRLGFLPPANQGEGNFRVTFPSFPGLGAPKYKAGDLKRLGWVGTPVEAAKVIG